MLIYHNRKFMADLTYTCNYLNQSTDRTTNTRPNGRLSTVRFTISQCISRFMYLTSPIIQHISNICVLHYCLDYRLEMNIKRNGQSWKFTQAHTLTIANRSVEWEWEQRSNEQCARKEHAQNEIVGCRWRCRFSFFPFSPFYFCIRPVGPHTSTWLLHIITHPHRWKGSCPHFDILTRVSATAMQTRIVLNGKRRIRYHWTDTLKQRSTVVLHFPFDCCLLLHSKLIVPRWILYFNLFHPISYWNACSDASIVSESLNFALNALNRVFH